MLLKKKKRFLDFSDFKIDIRDFPRGSSGLDSASSTEGAGSIPGWRTKIPCAVWHSQKTKANKQTKPTN